MASAVETQRLASRNKIVSYDHDPGATTAIVTSPDGGTTKRVADMSVYERFGVLAMISVLGTGGALTKLEIIASAASDMSSPVVVKDSGTLDADAVGDQIFAECSIQEARKLLAGARYLAGRLTMDAADAECVVTYILSEPSYPADGLTPSSTIA